MEKTGVVTHFFGNIKVAVVELEKPLRTGDKVRVKGATTDFEQEIKSMQVEHSKVEEAKAGDSIGLKVKDVVRQGDEVYKL